MEMEILTVGSVTFMKQVFTGIAMIGRANYNTLGMIGLLLALLLVAGESVLSGGSEFKIQTVFISFLVFVLFFGSLPGVDSRVRVTLIDSYGSGEAAHVDNVPFGTAAIMTLGSKLAVGLTRVIQQAYSYPTATGGHRFGYTLDVLLAQRDVYFGRVMTVPIAQHIENVTAYMRDCVRQDYTTNMASPDALFRSADALAAVKTTNAARMTLFTPLRPDGSPSGPPPGIENGIGNTPGWEGSREMLSCPQAHARLVESQDAYMDALKTELSRRIPHGDPISEMNNAYVSLGALSHNAQQQAVNMMVATGYERGVVHGGSASDAAYAALISPAESQRNIQWAAEETIFSKYVRPVLTFMEGLFVMITPFMALLLASGLAGIKLGANYIKVYAWILLWVPILAMVNLYQTMAMAGEFEALINPDALPTTSILATQMIYLRTENWLSMGGMLASMTPGIAAMLVYGGSITVTSLIGRMQGSDFVSEKNLAPDLQQTGSVSTRSSLSEGNPSQVLKAPGSGGTFGYIEQSTMTSAQRTEAYGNMETSGRSLSDGISRVAMNNEGFSETYNRGLSYGFDAAAQTGAGKDLAHRVGEDTASKLASGSRISEEQSRILTGTVKGDAALQGLARASAMKGAGRDAAIAQAAKQVANAINAGAGVSGSSSDKTAMSASQEQQLIEAVSSGMIESNSLKALTAYAMGVAVNEGQMEGATRGLSESDSKTVSDVLTDTAQTSASYQKSFSLANSAGSGMRIPLENVTRTLQSNGAASDVVSAAHKNWPGLAERKTAALAGAVHDPAERAVMGALQAANDMAGTGAGRAFFGQFASRMGLSDNAPRAPTDNISGRVDAMHGAPRQPSAARFGAAGAAVDGTIAGAATSLGHFGDRHAGAIGSGTADVEQMGVENAGMFDRSAGGYSPATDALNADRVAAMERQSNDGLSGLAASLPDAARSRTALASTGDFFRAVGANTDLRTREEGWAYAENTLNHFQSAHGHDAGAHLFKGHMDHHYGQGSGDSFLGAGTSLNPTQGGALEALGATYSHGKLHSNHDPAVKGQTELIGNLQMLQSRELVNAGGDGSRPTRPVGGGGGLPETKTGFRGGGGR